MLRSCSREAGDESSNTWVEHLTAWVWWKNIIIISNVMVTWYTLNGLLRTVINI